MWRINSVEEITTTTTEAFSDEELDRDDDDEDELESPEHHSNDHPFGGLHPNSGKVAFPEAGIDLIDFDANQDSNQDFCVKCFDCQHWQENWLFRKGKKMDNKSDLIYGYMAMILAELPVHMLIPNPILKIRASVGDRDVDQLSELSEHNSVGSLEFSDTESECESDVTDRLIPSEQELPKRDNDCIESQSQALATVCETNAVDNERNQSEEMNVKQVVVQSEVAQTRVVDSKDKPIVKLVTKVPNYVPKELRSDGTNGKSDPYLVLRPGDACVQSAITVQFCCRAKGSKPLLFSWFKSDVLLKSDHNYRIFQSGDQNVLEIMNTSVECSDQYSCVVYNRFGYQWCDFTLDVKNTSFLSEDMKNKKPNIRPEMGPKAKAVSDCEVSKLTINPKHDKQKARPIVIQRTWAERVAELRTLNSGREAQNNHQNETTVCVENSCQRSDGEDETHLSVPTVISCAIADREHMKWQKPDIDWKDNPYSIENLNTRIQQRTLSLGLDCETTDRTEEAPVIPSFLSSSSKDLSRYQKDYYVRQQPISKDETLRSFDESEYSNPKYLDFKRKSSEDMSETSNDKNSNETESEVVVSDCDSLLPSVKDLVNRFSFAEQTNDKIPKLVDIKRKNSFSDSKLNILSKNFSQTNSQNFKVHSLTARSLTKEFRQMSALNLPRTQRNRMDMSGHNRPVSLIESESSSPSTPCSPTNEGYVSDDSNTSSIISSSGNLSLALHKRNVNNERKFSPSILKRTSYWQKRCEQGLISDCSVNEDFPPMETIAD